ncbi:MAG: hypothetical protein H5T69_09595, partial [Chloroflexi bacterium]|nr:hypothetical protein [Chloroflexota bacterium]
ISGLRYADEPAIAIIELVNENSILDNWVRGILRGENTEEGAEWVDLPPAYAKDLDRRWNTWLAQRYTDRDALLEAWQGDLRPNEDPALNSVRRLRREEFATASGARFRDEATFYAEMEKDFFREMASFLRSVGAQQLILGTSDYNHRWSALPMLESNATLDLIDGHVYWQHPRFPGVRWSPVDWIMTNTPMLDDPDHSVPAQLSRSQVQGLPYIVSEVNEPFPHEYAAELIPILSAYALLQDWDGLFWFAYGGGTEEQWKSGAIPRFFSMANDPLKMTQTALGALMFLRGDVAAAQKTVERRMPHDWVLESLRVEMPDDRHPFWYPYLPGRLALVHRTAIADFYAEELAPAEGEIDLPMGDTIASDTGQLLWHVGEGGGRVLIDTPLHQGVIGRAGRLATSQMQVDLRTPFAALQVASLDNRPLRESGRLLMLTAARVANTGMRWTDESHRSVGDQWGTAPTRIEPVQATVTLSGLKNAHSLALQPLDGYGQPTAPSRSLPIQEGKVILELPTEYPTLWYLLTIQR